MDMSWVAAFAAFISSVTVIVGALWVMWRKGIVRLLRLAEDLFGEPERRGASGVIIAPARPGAMERLAILELEVRKINAELHPNGGKSFRDRVEVAIRGPEADVAERVDDVSR